MSGLDERAAIVAWLRAEAAKLHKLAHGHGRLGQFEAAYVVYVAGRQNDKIADCIQAGDHLANPTPGMTKE